MAVDPKHRIERPFDVAPERRKTQRYEYAPLAQSLMNADNDELLGNILVKHGAITNQQLAEALIAQFAHPEDNQPALGALLVKLEMITPRQLYMALKDQALKKTPQEDSKQRMEHARQISTSALSSSESIANKFDNIMRAADAAIAKLSRG